MKKHFFAIYLFIVINTIASGLSYYRDWFSIENTSDENLTFTEIRQDGITSSVDIYRNGVFVSTIMNLRVHESIKFPLVPKGEIIIMTCHVNITIKPIEKFHGAIKEFFVYDSDGNIILTIEDINEDFFTTSGDMTNEYNHIDHILRITPEMVEAGRKKYSNNIVEE
ncbi:hypothetical protein FACS189462_0620 [Spirochaetia bacterium]|nr:hypothetical protein FACS189462_0620 [Spirochaetia bacterium]